MWEHGNGRSRLAHGPSSSAALSPQAAAPADEGDKGAGADTGAVDFLDSVLRKLTNLLSNRSCWGLSV